MAAVGRSAFFFAPRSPAASPPAPSVRLLSSHHRLASQALSVFRRRPQLASAAAAFWSAAPPVAGEGNLAGVHRRHPPVRPRPLPSCPPTAVLLEQNILVPPISGGNKEKGGVQRSQRWR